MQKLSLQQKLQQKLSPLQIQVIKLLEVPAMEMEQRIKKELEENPALEEGKTDDVLEAEKDENVENTEEDFSLDEYLNEDDIPNYKLHANNFSKDDKKTEIPFSVGVSFLEALNNQLRELPLSEEDKSLAKYIIGNIDEDGYLRRDIMSMADDLAFISNINVPDEKLEGILFIIQHFEPAGIGARDLRECLLLQIKRRDTNIPSVKLAALILEKYFTEFTKKHYEKIISRANISQQEMKEALDEILKMNPKPGSSFANSDSKNMPYIIPDFILDEVDDELILTLNSKNVPDLRLSNTYSEMLSGLSENKNKGSKDQKDAAVFVKQKLDAAKWFIEAIKQRHNTLLSTMQSIVEFQEAHFKSGDETDLRPMHLKDIAEVTGYDISTISRVSNSKHIQTNFGIFSVKYFFSDGMQTESGEEVSTKEIKTILAEAIDMEDKRKPLTDDKLVDLLTEKGYKIARRTIAKYREQLNIPVARLRKEML